MTEMRESGTRFASARDYLAMSVPGVLLVLIGAALVLLAGCTSEDAPERPGEIRVNLAAVDLRPELLPHPDCSFEIRVEVMDNGTDHNAYSEVICP